MLSIRGVHDYTKDTDQHNYTKDTDQRAKAAGRLLLWLLVSLLSNAVHLCFQLFAVRANVYQTQVKLFV